MATRSNDDKLDLLADLMDPVSLLAEDGELMELAKNGQRKSAIQRLLRNHKPEIIEILALIEGEDPQAYRIEGPMVAVKLLAWISDNKEIIDGLFPTPAQSADAASSGQHTGNTTEEGL